MGREVDLEGNGEIRKEVFQIELILFGFRSLRSDKGFQVIGNVQRMIIIVLSAMI